MLSPFALPLLLLQAHAASGAASPMGVVPGLQEPPLLLKALTSVPATRPLDPNGIDVYGELPVMKRAYAQTANGAGDFGRAEAGYGIFRSDPGYGRTGFHFGNELHMSIPMPQGGMAVVHTHPQKGQPQPSEVDTHEKYPNYVYSGDKLYVTNPQTHKYFQYDIDKWGMR